MKAISFQQVTKSFKSHLKRTTVVHELSLDVFDGEVFGFLGPNGAGKSTSIKMLLNFLNPDAGKITVAGLTVGRDNFQHLIGYLPETPCFYENLTGLETLLFSGQACGMTKAQAKDSAAQVLERLNLTAAQNNRIKTYSKGMKQRLGIAMALIHDPRIYILDEPMSGLDPIGRRLIADVIVELREKGKTVFFSSHILSDIERLCDRIGILNKGHLLQIEAVDAVRMAQTDMEEVFINMIEQDERARHE